MAQNAWNCENRHHEISLMLDSMLDCGCDAVSLASAVEACAAAAEAMCSGRPMACTVGCPHCCVLNVAILLPEGLIIANYLRKRLSRRELTEIRRLLAVHGNSARWMEDEERIAKKAFCPLLDNSGNCSVHLVRPLSCRGVASLDNNRCCQAFDQIISDQERTVPADLLRRSAYDAAFSILADKLSKRGFDPRSIELGTGVLAFLDHPEFEVFYLAGGKLPRELWG